jgi:hypothetical protein
MNARSRVPALLLAAAAAAAAATWPAPAEAGARRALLVGIDHYEAPGRSSDYGDLEGAVRDAKAIGEILVRRFGFRREDVTVLSERDATREGILAALGRVLDASQPGDLVVFEYSGHGSQLKNPDSPEPDKLDETIVPADGRDIRDKELARLFGKAADRDVQIVAFYDSCHSGSISRGPSVARRVRAMRADPNAVVHDGADAPRIAEKGAVVFSAAQDYQSALEDLDDHGEPHGVFSMALLAALEHAPPEVSVERLYALVRARMKASGASQEPALDAGADRRRAPLLGGKIRGAQGRMLVTAAGPLDGGIELLDGWAIGLAPGAVLVRVTAGKPEVRLRVAAVKSLTSSVAKPAGPADGAVAIEPGDQFAVERWTAVGTPVRIYLGPTVGAAELAKVAAALRPLRRSPALVWVDDPGKLIPTHVVFCGEGGWFLRGPDGAVAALGKGPTASAIQKQLPRPRAVQPAAAPGAPDPRPRLWVRLPPTPELAAALESGRAEGAPARRVSAEADATYLLAGREGARPGALEYAWVLASASDRPSPLPRATRWVAAAARTAAPELDDLARRLARVYSWLRIEGPPDDSSDFPYRLAFRPYGGTELLPPETPLRGEQRYELVLQAVPGATESYQRYVYVIGVNREGEIQVLYPPDKAGLDNRFPTAVKDGLPPLIPLGKNGIIEVGKPYGVDTYLLLATTAPIQELRKVEQEGVTKGGGGDPMVELLSGLGNTRSATSAAAVPGGWTLDRVSVLSVEP